MATQKGLNKLDLQKQAKEKETKSFPAYAVEFKKSEKGDLNKWKHIKICIGLRYPFISSSDNRQLTKNHPQIHPFFHSNIRCSFFTPQKNYSELGKETNNVYIFRSFLTFVVVFLPHKQTTTN